MTQSSEPIDLPTDDDRADHDGEKSAQAGGNLSATPARRTDRDLQRSALSDLVDLATQCAATEARIEETFHDETHSAARERDEAIDSLGLKLDSLERSVQQKRDEGAGEASSQFDFDARQLRESEQASTSRITAEFETVDQEIKQKLDGAVWLAESVFEAAQIQVRKNTEKAEEQHKTEMQQIADLEKTAREQLDEYRVKLLPSAEAAPEKESYSSLDAAQEGLKQHREAIEHRLDRLRYLFVPKLFVGMRPYLIGVFVLIAAGVTAQLMKGPTINGASDFSSLSLQGSAIGYAMLFAAIGLALIGVLLRFLAVRQTRAAYLPLERALTDAELAAKSRLAHQARAYDSMYSHALRKRDAEIKAAKDHAAPKLAQAKGTRDAAARISASERKRQLDKLQARRDKATGDLDHWLRHTLSDLKQRYDRDVAAITKRHDDRSAKARQVHDDARAALEFRWNAGLQRIQAIDGSHEGAATNGDGDANGSTTTAIAPVLRDWQDSAWRNWTPPRTFQTKVPFGQLKVDLKTIAESVPRDGSSRLALPDEFSLPALLAFPRQSSLLIGFDRAGRENAIRTLQMLMTRLITSQPAGRVRFTIIDPVGLGQNFAGFMHLADHDEALVGGRIWTNAEHIDQRLTDLTEHMETVIQKYLRNEFETIDDYNAQAGELAEPYRFLVISDFPISCSPEAIQKLNSIASTGSRCGVYTLIARDLRAPMPGGAHIDEIVAHSINLVQQSDGKFAWKDEVFERFPLVLDPPPEEASLTSILNTVGRHAKDASRVEVPFESIAPKPDQMWSGDCTSELRVPIGRMGATRSQLMKLGRGVAQHALIAGKTGSGKSTLLHVLVTNVAMWYSPDEVEFYLVDFKKGVEFKTYATHLLPHARAIAVESDREFGLSVLQRLDAELSRRGEIFRKLGVQDLAAYRAASGKKMPRTLLIIDEFQEFFSEDDKLAQDSSLLIDRLVRQGRAFGLHVILGSQTIGGSSSLARSTIGQMAVRIALQTSEADSQLILGDNNSAARLLSRPGEAIYNDQGGLVESNSPFQISWLPDAQRDEYLDQVEALAKAQASRSTGPEPIVFEGNAAADVEKNRRLSAALAATSWSETESAAPVAWMGEPVAIKDPSSLSFRRQSGANALLVGQQEESALAIMTTAIVSLAAQHAPDRATFYVFDGTPADSALAGAFVRAADAVPHAVTLVEWRAVEETIDAIAKEMKRRQEANDETNPPAIFVLIYGLQRFRVLRKSDDGGFSFGSSEDEQKSKPDKQFADVLREGPALGIHVIAWADAPAAVDRTLDRTSLREFDHRVLFQMSANDSSNLIDSPAANKLGFHRALAFSEEQGVMEKFRPYGLPTKAWLDLVKKLLAKKK